MSQEEMENEMDRLLNLYYEKRDLCGDAEESSLEAEEIFWSLMELAEELGMEIDEE